MVMEKIAQYAPRVNDADVIMGDTDRRTNASHTADALRYALMGLQVRNGSIQRAFPNFTGGFKRVCLPTWGSGSRVSRRTWRSGIRI